MYRIVKKRVLNPTVTMMEIEAPIVARKAEPGQFIILRVDENGERIPLTIAAYDREAGTVSIIYQIVGATTEKLNHKEEGEYIQDFVGPLGRATETEGLKRVAVVGGGVGTAIAYPVAKKLHDEGCHVDLIVGFPQQGPHHSEGGVRGCLHQPDHWYRRWLLRQEGPGHRAAPGADRCRRQV